MITFTFSLVLRTRENTDVFIILDENVFGIHSKRVNILYLFSQKTAFDISRKLSPLETICMKCQIMFPWKYKNNIINMSSAD